LIRGAEPCFSVENVPLPPGILHRARERSNAAENLALAPRKLPLPPGTLQRRTEPSIAPRKSTLRRRTLRCAREGSIALENLSLPQIRADRLRHPDLPSSPRSGTGGFRPLCIRVAAGALFLTSSPNFREIESAWMLWAGRPKRFRGLDRILASGRLVVWPVTVH
jgi:hypothetical protein